MTDSRVARVTALTIVFGLALGSCRTPALAAGYEVWRGQYVCAQGVTDLTLVMNVDKVGDAYALFEFYADRRNPTVPSGCFEMSGSKNNSGHVSLMPGAWRLRPDDYVAVGLVGDVHEPANLTGEIEGPGCGSFVLKQDLAPRDAVTECAGADS